MSDTVIRISEDGKVTVERDLNGVKSFKQIAPDTLIQCIDRSLLRGAVHKYCRKAVYRSAHLMTGIKKLYYSIRKIKRI